MGLDSFNPFRRTEQQPSHLAGDVEHEPLKVPGEQKSDEPQAVDAMQRVAADVEEQKQAALERAAKEFAMSVDDIRSFNKSETAGERGAKTYTISGVANGIPTKATLTTLPAIPENAGKEHSTYTAEVGSQVLEDSRKAGALYDHLRNLITRRDFLIEGKARDLTEELLLKTAVGEEPADKIRDVLHIKQ